MNTKVQILIDRVRSVVSQNLSKLGCIYGDSQIDDAIQKAVEEAYTLGYDDANCSWQSIMSEALNSGPGYYKP